MTPEIKANVKAVFEANNGPHRFPEWRLVYEKTGDECLIRTHLTSSRGERYILVGGNPPHKPSSTGRVYVQPADTLDWERQFYPGVFDLRWVHISEVNDES